MSGPCSALESGMFVEILLWLKFGDRKKVWQNSERGGGWLACRISDLNPLAFWVQPVIQLIPSEICSKKKCRTMFF